MTFEQRMALLTARAAAPLLGVGIAGTYRLASSGRLPYVKLAGKERKGGRGRAGAIRFRLCDVIAFQVENEVGAS